MRFFTVGRIFRPRIAQLTGEPSGGQTLAMHAPVPLTVIGDTTGLSIPIHADALIAAGPDWLTRACHAYGSLAPDNAVTAITHAAIFSGGNSGQKLQLSVSYARPEPHLPRDLFVKLSRDWTDPFRDRRRLELEAEVRLAQLSRLPAFPVEVPRAVFADFELASGTGLLITERIAFGTGDIEPLHEKYMDHLLPEPLAYYRTLLGALARLAGAHQAGRLSPDAERLFPFDAAAAAAELPIPYDEEGMRAAIARYSDFVRDCPQLLPAHLTEPGFIARLEADALAFLAREQAVRRFLHADPELIALAHWNGHIDNAWFHRDSLGALHCGLMDWGMVRQMNLGISLWGSLSGMDHALLAAHSDDLLAHFADELAAAGGARLDLPRLALHFDLSAMLLGLSMMFGAPALVRQRLPEITSASGPFDPMLLADPVARGFLCVFVNCLNMWHARDFGASLARVPG